MSMKVDYKPEAIYLRLGESYGLDTMEKIRKLCERMKGNRPGSNIIIDCSQLVDTDHISGELFSFKKEITDPDGKVFGFIVNNPKTEGVLRLMYGEIVGEGIKLFESEDEFRRSL